MISLIGSDNRTQNSELRNQKSETGKKKNLLSVFCSLFSVKCRSSSGFTLVEVMVAVVVLSVGLIIIYEAFLTSIDTINLFFNRLNAQLFISEKIWQMQDNLDQPQSSFLFSERGGTIKYANRDFNWQINLKLDDAAQELYQIDALISWPEGQKVRTIRRITKVLKQFSNVEAVVDVDIE